MNVASILSRLEASGVHVRAEGGKLHVSPRESVTDDLLELIRENKPAILAALEVVGKAESRHWRWIFHHADGTQTEYRILPEPTLSELRALYPNVSSFTPLAETLQ